MSGSGPHVMKINICHMLSKGALSDVTYRRQSVYIDLSVKSSVGYSSMYLRSSLSNRKEEFVEQPIAVSLSCSNVSS